MIIRKNISKDQIIITTKRRKDFRRRKISRFEGNGRRRILPEGCKERFKKKGGKKKEKKMKKREEEVKEFVS